MCRAAHIAVLLALSAAAALADTSPSTDVAEASPMLSSPMPSSPEVSSDNYPLLATLPRKHRAGLPDAAGSPGLVPMRHRRWSPA